MQGRVQDATHYNNHQRDQHQYVIDSKQAARI